MKKLIFLCSMIFITMSSVLAQSNILIQISIENEYTGILESPLQYGLSTNDLEYQLINLNNGLDLWAPSFSRWVYKDERAYVADLLTPSDSGNTYRCTVKINKPGHKLHGLTASFEFLQTISSVQWFSMENGIVFKIPQCSNPTSLLNKTMDKFRIDAR